MKFIVGDVAAAISGLEPVSGATVELIRIDNSGDQVGDVLAQTVTSIDGSYVLTLPTGVNLAGDLVVRITGAGNSEMRAQVVQEAVNISPTSEFILRKFIENETDLKVLEPSAVVKLSGRVEQFDLTAGSDLSAVFEQLEASVGEYIESQIEVIQAEPGNASNISGAYRSASMQLALHDSKVYSSGTFAVDLWRSNFVFTGNADGFVEVEHLGEESAWGSVRGNDEQMHGFNYSVDMEEKSETFSAVFNSSNALVIEGEFEEEIDGDFAWRWPPVTYRLQKVRDQNLFFQLSQEASVRYATIDTNNDGEKDALNPDAVEGEEVNRGLEVFFKAPTDMTTSAVSGSFGRVYLGVIMTATGHMEIETEANLLEFGAGSLDYSAAERNRISRNSAGQVEAHVESADAEDLEFAIAADGQLSINNELTDGYFNDTADFAAFSESNGEDETEAGFSQTLFVKLPAATPNLANKRYRVMFLDTEFRGKAWRLTNTRFDSVLTWTSNTAGTAALSQSTVVKANMGAQIVSGVIGASDRAVTAQIAANGAATLNIADPNGALRLKGYWNATASYGIFTTGYIPTGETVPQSAGLAVLVEITD